MDRDRVEREMTRARACASGPTNRQQASDAMCSQAPLPAVSGSLGGPKERFGVLFLDDIHMAPVAESENVWSLLRQLISERFVFPLVPSAGLRRFPWAPIRHMAYVVTKTLRPFQPRALTMGDSCVPAGSDAVNSAVGAEEAWSDLEVGRAIRSRSLTSFVHLTMLPPTRSETLAILSRGLRTHFSETCARPDILKLMDSICSATVMVLEALGGVLRSSRPACAYAQMDLRKVVKIARAMCRVRGDQLRSKREAIVLFLHETRQSVCDTLMRPDDRLTCQKHIARVCAKVFSKEQDRKNKRALMILEVNFLTDLQNCEYAYLTPAQAEKLPRQVDQKDDLTFDASLLKRSCEIDSFRTISCGIGDGASAAAERAEDQSATTIRVSDGAMQDTSLAKSARQGDQYAMIKGSDGLWLVELYHRIPFAGTASMMKLKSLREEEQLLVLNLVRHLWNPPSDYDDEHGVQVLRDHAIPPISPTATGQLRATAVESEAAFEHIHPKDALVMVEKQRGSSIEALKIAASSLKLNFLCMDEMIGESDRQKLASLPWDSDGMKVVSRDVLVAICSNIARHCGVENSNLVLVCPQQVALPDLIVPLMHIMLTGHVLDHLVASQKAQTMAEIQKELEHCEDNFEAKKPLMDLPMRARMLLSRRMAKNFQLVLILQSECFMHRDWTRVYDSPSLAASGCAVLSLQAATESLFKDCNFLYAAHESWSITANVAIAPASRDSNASGKQSLRDFASKAVVRSFEACGLRQDSSEPRMMLVMEDVVDWLISVPHCVLKSLSSHEAEVVSQQKDRPKSTETKKPINRERNTLSSPGMPQGNAPPSDLPATNAASASSGGLPVASHEFAGMGLEHFSQRFLEEFARIFEWKGK